MASWIKAFLLILFISLSQSQNCEIPSEWTSFPSVEETIKIDDLFLEVEDDNTKNITGMWTRKTQE